MSGKASLVKNLEIWVCSFLRKICESTGKNRPVGDSKKNLTPADLPFIVTDVLDDNVNQRLRLEGAASRVD